MKKNAIIGVAVVVLVLIGGIAYTAMNHVQPGKSATNVTPPIRNRTNTTTVTSSLQTTTQATTSIQSTTTISSQQNSTLQTQNPTDFIVVNPVNLAQISQISKFRSCSGHDYSGYDVQGYPETQRSMKHYFYPTQQFHGTVGKIQEYAPFNGTIESMAEEQTPVGKQVWIGYTQSGPMFGFAPIGVWNAVFFHLDPIAGLSVGAHVTAGELIGYANQTAPVNQTFDIALEEYNGSNGNYHQVLDSIFNHMDSQVLSQYAAVGVTPNGIIIPKAYRDANPCNFNIYNPNDTVTLT
ncbi:MAG: hypothetical protein KGH59_03010 [Candidatus Micrarchaeota archaeon]|nr:hypothetical protein [Candidatus Micrarchaeota archaeon]